MPDARERSRAFLAGANLTFDEANALWRQLLKDDEPSLARSVLSAMRAGDQLSDGLPAKRSLREKLCQQEAMLTSKDPELSSAVRHDRALEVLTDEFDLDDPRFDDVETLGIAGGILKRRWVELGQHRDLQRSAELYLRGAGDDLGEDAYAHINAAFLEDLLASTGDDPGPRRARAKALRERIAEELPVLADNWWNAASRAEALFGLRRYGEAKTALEGASEPEAPWQLETTSRQLATIAHMHEERPLDVPEVRAFFKTLLPGSADAVNSAFVGKVGLALSGGGFRASFYHLGVLARLAELDVLRHIDVLSCVSGGSIIGACYWLALRRRLLDARPLEQGEYVQLVRDLIDHFEKAVAVDLRGRVQPSIAALAFQTLVRGQKGALDPEATANALEEHFFRPLLRDGEELFMDRLAFTPADHDPKLAGSPDFNPGRHNWLRAHKVPALVLNATTVNTGHAWQFTPRWMGESPWAVHEAADAVPRLEWAWYSEAAGWRARLGRAVAASACVPGIFAPLRINDAYEEEVDVQLVDGGVYDNQGTVSLLASNCNVLLVSDAAGQLMLQAQPTQGLKGVAADAKRSMDTLMERIRQANYGDLSVRARTGLVRGLMFIHMKEGLDADTIRLRFSQEAFDLRRRRLTPAGVRKEFQQAIAELRTDLDAFTLDESRALMACGYQMASKGFQRDLQSRLRELWKEPADTKWPFDELLAEITSVAPATDRREDLLGALREGSRIRL